MRLEIVAGLAVASCLLAGTARGQSALQVTPDGKRTLINKQVGDELWAITLNDDDLTVSGNVRDAGGAAQFLFCTPGLTATPRDVRLSCESALPCLTEPCDPSAWQFASNVLLPISFFRPPAGPTPTPVPTADLRELRGRWRFAYGFEPPETAVYLLDWIAYQFTRPVLLGVDTGSAPVSVGYYGDGGGDPPPYELAMLVPGSSRCLLNLFSHPSFNTIAGVTYVLGVAADGSCLTVALGQQSIPLGGERVVDTEGASRDAPEEETAPPTPALAGIVEMLQASLR